MRAKLFVNLPMLSFREQMQIDFAHDRAIAIRIARRPLRLVPVSDAEVVIQITGRRWDPRAKEPVTMNFVGVNWRARLSIHQELYFLGIGSENAHDQVVPTNRWGPKIRKGSGWVADRRRSAHPAVAQRFRKVSCEGPAQY
jgi:hypothetical protein